MMDGTCEQTNQQDTRLEAVKSKPFRQQAIKRILKYRQASNEVTNLLVMDKAKNEHELVIL